MKRVIKLNVYVLCFAGLLLAFNMLIWEPRRINVVEYYVYTDKWHSPKPLRIALIADVHAIWPWMSVAHIQRIVEKTNALSPDLTLLLGDYVATHPFGFPIKASDGVKPYEQLRADCGVYAVIGNHDLHGSVGWPEALRNTTVPVLENSSVFVQCDQGRFYVAGLEDLWWQNADVNRALSNVEIGVPVILAMHNPDSFPEVPKDVALSVAGHTHAGQVRLPFGGAVESVIPSKYGKRYHYGYVHEDGKDLVVSGGLGNSGIPMRLLNPPEIVIVTLMKK